MVTVRDLAGRQWIAASQPATALTGWPDHEGVEPGVHPLALPLEETRRIRSALGYSNSPLSHRAYSRSTRAT